MRGFVDMYRIPVRVLCLGFFLFGLLLYFTLFQNEDGGATEAKEWIDPVSNKDPVKDVNSTENSDPTEDVDPARNGFRNFDNKKGTTDGRYIVPNYVHFIRFGLEEFSFMDAVCVLAALKNQRPERLFIHSDGEPSGKYWDVLLKQKTFRDVLEWRRLELPEEVFGQKLSEGWRKWHGGDVARLRVLMRWGGIFLDNDSYIVRSLDDLRRYEMTLGWMEGENIANQVILAHPQARFLRLWLDTYKGYNASLWYYNAGEKPTIEVLVGRPYLIHREKYLLANHHITWKLYMEQWPEWKSHYAFHLLYHHQYLFKNISEKATYPVEFDEVNIDNYPVTIRDMVRDVYPAT